MKRLLLILTVISTIACDSERTSFSHDTLRQSALSPHDGPVVARVLSADQASLNRLARQPDVWGTYHDESNPVSPLHADEYVHLQQPRAQVVIDRAKVALTSPPSRLIPSRLARIPDYPCYRTVEETYADLAHLASTHPDLASWVDIGDSWDKATAGGPAGYDLFALVLTNKAKSGPKPRFFLMAAIHARELATAELATRFAEQLVADYGVDPDVTWLLDYIEIHIVPMVNPDGRKWAEQGQSWRKNTDNANGCTTFPNYGTDLNRNSSFHWGEGITDPCGENYIGPSAVSEPETLAIQNYVASLFPDQRGPGDEDLAPNDATGVFISLHSYMPGVIFPYEFRSTPAPNDPQLRTLGRKFGYFNGYAVCQAGDADCMYVASGTAEDWAYGQLGVAAYNFELGDAFSESCSDFEGTTVPKNVPALVYAIKAARRPYQSPAGPEPITATVTLTSVVAGTPVTLTAVADDTRYNSNGWGTEPVQNIVAARYTVDAPSWITGVVPYSMSPADGAFDSSVEPVWAVVSTAGWTPGRHVIFVESKDAAGYWGVPSAVFLRIPERYGLTLTPTSAMKQAYPGEMVTYTLRLTNTGNVSDTFDLATIGNTWTTLVASVLGPLKPGMGADLSVNVSVPAAAMAGAADTAQVTLTSRGDPSKSSNSALTTTANAIYGLALQPSAMMRSGDPGTQVTYTLRVTNTGNIADTLDVAATGNAWTTIVASTLGPLAGYTGADLQVVVSVPATVTTGATDMVEITLTSQGDPSNSSTSVLSTPAYVVHGLALKPPVRALSGDTGAQVAYTLRVTNTGNVADTFDVAAAGNAWRTTLASTVGPLAAGAGVDLSVNVSVPTAAIGGTTDRVEITLTSQGNPAQSFSSVLTTTANAVYGLTLEPPAMTGLGSLGTTVTYTLRFTNTGNTTETLALDYVGSTWNVQLLPAINVTLTAGAGSNIIARVTIPPTATGRPSDTVLVKVMGAGLSKISALTTQVVFHVYLPLVTKSP